LRNEGRRAERNRERKLRRKGMRRRSINIVIIVQRKTERRGIIIVIAAVVGGLRTERTMIENIEMEANIVHVMILLRDFPERTLQKCLVLLERRHLTNLIIERKLLKIGLEMKTKNSRNDKGEMRYSDRTP
jgi:hypothetical protein